MIVSSVDWSKTTNQIVTCSHDRNAFVWNFDKAKKRWVPKLVILRIDRAANQVKWSPNGEKFAVASSTKKVPVCHYESDNNWWTSEMIKKHRSTVLCLAWHPNSQLIVTGSCDFRCRVFSAYVDGVDGEKDFGPFEGQLDDDLRLGDMIVEFTAKGWVEAVAWSPAGKKLAYASHDSSLIVVDFSGSEVVNQVLKLKTLPLRSIEFVSETRIIGVGYDFLPFLYDLDKDGWAPTGTIDTPPKDSKKGKEMSAMERFHEMDKKGSKTGDVALLSKHDNTITDLRLKNTTTAGNVYSTTGLDTNIYEWTVPLKK